MFGVHMNGMMTLTATSLGLPFSFVTVQLLPTVVLWRARQAVLSQPAKEVPIARPRPKVIPAASNPKMTCLVPE